MLKNYHGLALGQLPYRFCDTLTNEPLGRRIKCDLLDAIGGLTRSMPDFAPVILLVRHPDPSRLNRSGLALKNLLAAFRLVRTGSVLAPESEFSQTTLDPPSPAVPTII